MAIGHVQVTYSAFLVLSRSVPATLYIELRESVTMARTAKSDVVEVEGDRQQDGADSIADMKGVNPTYAEIMADSAPNPWGAGHIKMYCLASVLFLNATMNGK